MQPIIVAILYCVLQIYSAKLHLNPAHWFQYVYGTPEKMIAAFPRLKISNCNVSML